MTNAADLTARAIREIESAPGYHYSRGALEAAIEAGIPEGEMFMRRGDDATCHYFADRIEIRYPDGRVETMPQTDKTKDAALLVWAKRQARRAVGKIN